MGRATADARAALLSTLVDLAAQPIAERNRTSATGGSGVPARRVPAVAVVTGSIGMGKTHLLNEACARLSSEGADVRAVTADQTMTGRPGSGLACLIPELAAGPSSPHGGGGSPIGEAVRTVGELARARPLVLAVDDAHLADGLTLSALHHLARVHSSAPPSLLVARCAVPSRGPLTMLSGSSLATEVSLPRLTPAEVDRIALERLGVHPAPPVRQALDLAGGNPAQLHLILDALARTGRFSGESTADAGPARHELIDILAPCVESQLRSADPDALHTIRVLAVWNDPVTLDELARVRRRHPSDLIGGIETCVGAGIMRWHGERLWFESDVIAEVVRRGLDPRTRAVFEQAVADARGPRVGPETHVGPEPDVSTPVLRMQSSLQVAGRFPDTLAGPSGDARPATAAGSPNTGSPTTGSPTTAGPHDLADIESALARITRLSDAGRLEDAAALARSALEQHPDPANRVALLFSLLAFAVVGARTDDARALISRIRAEGSGVLPAESEAWLTEIGVWIGAMTGSAPRRSQIPQADAARSARLSGITGYGAAQAIGLALAGDCVSALQELESAIDANAGNDWIGAESPHAAAWPLWVTRFAYGPATTITRAPLASQTDDRLVTRWLGPFCQGVIAEAHMAAGELDVAAMLFDEAIADARRIGSGWMSTAVANRALIDVLRGAPRTALTGLDKWRRQGLPDRFGLPDISLALGETRLALGMPRNPGRDAGRLWRSGMRDGHVTWLLHRAPMISRQAILGGDRPLAERIARDAEQLRRRASAPALDGYALLAGAMGRGDPEAAEQAIGGFQVAGDVLGELAALEESACICAAHRDTAGARRTARAAMDLASRTGATATARRLRSRLRGAGIILGDRGHGGAGSGWEELTGAEARVSRLIAAGYTGPQIADKLGISARTVQTHVSHALKKLDFRTRAELAAYVTRES